MTGMLLLQCCLLLLSVVSVVRAYVSVSLSDTANQSVSYQSYLSFPFYDGSFSSAVGFKLTGHLYKCVEDENICNSYSDDNSTNRILVVPEDLDIHCAKDCYSLIIYTERDQKNILDHESIESYKVALSHRYVHYLLQNLSLHSNHSTVLAKINANNDLFIVVLTVLSTIIPVALAAFVCICVHFSCRYCNRMTYRQISASIHVRRPLGLRKTKQLPVQEYLEKSTEEMCVICQEVLRSGDPVKILPCGHRCFHPACINKWLIERNNKCPVCREKVRVKKRHTYSPISGQDNRTLDSDDSSLAPYLLPSDQYGSSCNSVSINFNKTL